MMVRTSATLKLLGIRNLVLGNPKDSLLGVGHVDEFRLAVTIERALDDEWQFVGVLGYGLRAPLLSLLYISQYKQSCDRVFSVPRPFWAWDGKSVGGKLGAWVTYRESTWL